MGIRPMGYTQGESYIVNLALAKRLFFSCSHKWVSLTKEYAAYKKSNKKAIVRIHLEVL
jgi:hypothetical protein